MSHINKGGADLNFFLIKPNRSSLYPFSFKLWATWCLTQYATTRDFHYVEKKGKRLQMTVFGIQSLGKYMVETQSSNKFSPLACYSSVALPRQAVNSSNSTYWFRRRLRALLNTRRICLQVQQEMVCRLFLGGGESFHQPQADLQWQLGPAGVTPGSLNLISAPRCGGQCYVRF